MKSFQKEKKNTLPKACLSDIYEDSDDYDTIYNRFHDVLLKAKEEYGFGFNNFLSQETGRSVGNISCIINKKKKASHKGQLLILKAIGIDYTSLLSAHTDAEKGKVKDLVYEVERLKEQLASMSLVIERDKELMAFMRQEIERLTALLGLQTGTQNRPDGESRKA